MAPVGALLAAIAAYVLPDTGTFYNLLWANLGTFLGAVCFLVAALLSRRTIGADEPAAAPGSVAA
ncbi:hypothetical protein [Agromyces binzhouensis]|uniref:Uncharacterized protein n=1 Tax=Agromyces binzhouensis TaxID=1817495 RepID=A0A4Q2JNT8_9MICO|nr:hypothetical protein [Agromyces binzhouensis]RXZ49891.1 hypothetical protein ESO86_04795 [Agromyces binzhouensis]